MRLRALADAQHPRLAPGLVRRRGMLRPLRARRRRPHGAQAGVLHRVHALPARGQPGHAPEHLRVPDDDLRADRHGRRQRLDVRRRHRLRRGRAHGRPRHQAAPVVVSRAASTPSGASSSTRTLPPARSPCDTCPVESGLTSPQALALAARRDDRGGARREPRTSSAISRTSRRSARRPTRPARCWSSRRTRSSPACSSPRRPSAPTSWWGRASRSATR